MATRQVNAKAFQIINIDDLFKNLKIEANSGNLSNDDQVGIFHILEKSISFVSQ